MVGKTPMHDNMFNRLLLGALTGVVVCVVGRLAVIAEFRSCNKEDKNSILCAILGVAIFFGVSLLVGYSLS